MNLLQKGGLVAAAALVIVGAAATPALAVGGNSQQCSGGYAYGNSTAHGNDSTDGSNCNGVDHVRVRIHYNASGGTAVTGSWNVSGTYVTYESIKNPGYTVFQGDHTIELAVPGWQTTFSE